MAKLNSFPAWAFPALSRDTYSAYVPPQGPRHPLTLLLSQPGLGPAMAELQVFATSGKSFRGSSIPLNVAFIQSTSFLILFHLYYPPPTPPFILFYSPHPLGLPCILCKYVRLFASPRIWTSETLE